VEAIAIRLQQENDFPYYKTIGFPKEFTFQEYSLKNMDFKNIQVAQELDRASIDCLCGCVINGLYDASLPFFTKRGSFHTNSTSLLLSQFDKTKMPYGIRKHCNDAGYESVLLVPLKVGENRLGLLQLNHKKKNHFTESFISLMEQLAHHVSVALIHRLAEENLQAKQVELEEMNATLKVLIRNREEDLLEHDQELLNNINQLVLPCVDRLKIGSLNVRQKAQLNVLETNLKTITSPFIKNLSSKNSALTPALIQVADMIKKGHSNKEIAILLGITVKSVETYRKRIRERLHLINSKVNLRAHLMSMD
jgi:DNA-binding CsgD family transcriptional regulator